MDGIEEQKTYLKGLVHEIGCIDQEAMNRARERQRQLAKVPGSLGRLEDISVRLAGITGKVTGNDVSRQCIAVFCADNGVVEEGVASAPQSVTLSQMINFTLGITGMSSMAKYFGIPVLTVDMGTKTPAPAGMYTAAMRVPEETSEPPKIVDRRIAQGTRNLACGPAMTEEQAVRGILTGFEAVNAMKAAGITLLGVGEMGIGNTTTSSALLAAASEIPAEMMVGRGGGLSDAGLARKVSVVQDAVDRCMKSRPEPADSAGCRRCCDEDDWDIVPVTADPDLAIHLLSELGGFDLCAMTGAYLGAARQRIPVVIDGFISSAAACMAQLFCPMVTRYMFASHSSTENGTEVAMERLGLTPLLDLGMRLGEGSGCIPAFKIIESSVAAMEGMATLAEGSVDGKYLDELSEHNYD